MHGCHDVLPNAMALRATEMGSLNKHLLRRRNRQIEDNLHLVRPIARHYALCTGQDLDDLVQVGCLGLIQACKRYEPQRGNSFTSFAKPHIRGAILHFLRDRVGLIRLPRAVEERAIQMTQDPERCMNAEDVLTVHHYRHKHNWVEFNDDLISGTTDGLDLVERTDAWDKVRTMFRSIGSDDQCALQMVVIDGRSLRQAAGELGVSAMTVQRRVKRGLNNLAKGLNKAQLEA